MALGALIGAYQEDDSGGLRALLPLAGRTLVEYQARCAAAAGASPIIILVERIPPALNAALDRLSAEGIKAIAVSDGNEAASRFEPGELILLVGDGVAPPVDLLFDVAEIQAPAVATVPDDEAHDCFERIDAVSRWAGVALVDSRTLGATAAMLGDWDLQSTLLRKSLQAGAELMPVPPEMADPLLAESPDQLAGFERRLIQESRSGRTDFASRYVLPIVEDFATEHLLERRVRPEWLVYLSLILTVAAAILFSRGWAWPGLAALLLSAPLDLVARRLAYLRLKPLGQRSLARKLVWPAAGAALLALGYWQWAIDGWGAFLAAASAAAFAHAARTERPGGEIPGGLWLFSRRNAILLAVPFGIAGAWTALLLFLTLYAGASFFFLQHLNHRLPQN